jgi:hypothetical protein
MAEPRGFPPSDDPFQLELFTTWDGPGAEHLPTINHMIGTLNDDFFASVNVMTLDGT